MGGTMKRRILSILLAAVVTAGTLLGCGSTKESTGTDKAAEASEETAADTTSDTEAATDAEPVEITIAYPSDDGAEEKLNILIDEFNKSYPNIKVNYILIPFSSWPDYITKLKTMVAGGTGPDVARLAVEGIQSFVADGMALPFDDFIAENADLMEELGVNDIHPNINAPFQVDGKTYGFAWDWNNIVMFLNKDVFAEKNIELPGSDWNKDKFLEIAQTLTYEKDGEKVYGTVAPTDYFTVTAWLYNNNASVLNEDMTEFGKYPSDNKVTEKPEILFARMDIKDVMEKVEEIKAAQKAETAEEKYPEVEKKPEITIDDFDKVQIQVGEVIKCEPVPKAKKLLVSQIKIGAETRQIVSGIAKYYKPEEMVGKKVAVITNLKPCKLCGVESQGMILAAGDDEGNLSVVTVDKDIVSGSEIC